MREYDEFVGRVLAVLGPAVLLLILLAGTASIAAAWYWYPAWVPRRLPRIRRPRFRLPAPRRRRPRHGTVANSHPRRPARPGPAPTSAAGSLADRLAAEGRYAEAIRERLRDTVADLTRAGLVAPAPGDTAAELAATAGAGRPAVSPALTRATGLFAEVWYGSRPAGAAEDDQMRHLTAEVRGALGTGDRR